MSILDSAKYDLGKICDSGDVGTAVTYYPENGLEVETHVIMRLEKSINAEGEVIGDVLTAIIQKNDIAKPQSGDRFNNTSTLAEYKVLEKVDEEDLFTRAIVEQING